MKSDKTVVIIGSGVVGLAISRELSNFYNDVFVIEKNYKFGEEISGRNSEVIHSGIYYKTGSLKASLCVEGNKLLYDYCEEKNISYNKCGKLIVSNSLMENTHLEKILIQGTENGVKNIHIIDKEEVMLMEPNIKCMKAIFVPNTGVFNSATYMQELEKDSKINGVEFVYGSKVTGICKSNEKYELTIQESDGSNFSFSTDIVVNSGGLNSDQISTMIGIKDLSYKLHFCKGEYFSVINGKNNLVNRLIYPLPDENLTGLGVHVTVDINHGMKLGPNAIYLDQNKIDYSVSYNNRKSFFESAKKFLPFLEEDDLIIGESGIRPKLNGPGEESRDFIIKEESNLGFKNFVNLIGIESPGLTSSLAIAKYVYKLLNKEQ